MHIEISAHQLGKPSAPYGIAKGLDDAIWFTENKGNHIGRINSTTFEVNRYLVPTPAAGLSIIAADSNDIWFTEYQANKIGRIKLNGGAVEYPLSSPAGPFGITAGQDKKM